MKRRFIRSTMILVFVSCVSMLFRFISLASDEFTRNKCAAIVEVTANDINSNADKIVELTTENVRTIDELCRTIYDMDCVTDSDRSALDEIISLSYAYDEALNMVKENGDYSYLNNLIWVYHSKLTCMLQCQNVILEAIREDESLSSKLNYLGITRINAAIIKYNNAVYQYNCLLDNEECAYYIDSIGYIKDYPSVDIARDPLIALYDEKFDGYVFETINLPGYGTKDIVLCCQ